MTGAAPIAMSNIIYSLAVSLDGLVESRVLGSGVVYLRYRNR